MPRPRLALLLLLILAAAVYIAGINWGLPSHAVDPFLFGARTAWTGKQIIELGGGWDDQPDVGADVARNPLANRDRPLLLNQTDAQRAQIVRRYRLFSYQPDEMITLRALAEMKPSKLQLDPKLYQYGGLWIYPVGALLRISATFHLIDLRGDVAWYLDHPEQFGRFYIVARAYTVLWALVGVMTVWALVRQLVGGWVYPFAAAACFIMMPVVMNMAHEAKPHLPGAVLMLLAVLAGSKYIETGSRRWWMTTGALCGAAVGMVLSSVPVFLILPAMVLLRPARWRERIEIVIFAGWIGAAVYLLSNPYIPINLFINREVLRSNFGNSSAMYHAQFTASGVGNALKLIAVGTGPLLALYGVGGKALLGFRAAKNRNLTGPDEIRRRATGILLAIPALWVMGQCIVFATGKPAEFGRFAILPDTFLLIEAIVAIATFVRQPKLAAVFITILWLTTALPGALYLRGFVHDAQLPTSRLALAEALAEVNASGRRTISVPAEPAPYCLPPVDLWNCRIVLLPRGSTTPSQTLGEGILIRPVDVTNEANMRSWLWGTPISWADKPFALSGGE